MYFKLNNADEVMIRATFDSGPEYTCLMELLRLREVVKELSQAVYYPTDGAKDLLHKLKSEGIDLGELSNFEDGLTAKAQENREVAKIPRFIIAYNRQLAENYARSQNWPQYHHIWQHQQLHGLFDVNIYLYDRPGYNPIEDEIQSRRKIMSRLEQMVNIKLVKV